MLRIFIFIFILGVIPNTFSQGFRTCAEMGFFGGGGYYIGDINPDKHFVDSKPSYGFIFRYNLTKRYSMRFNATYGNVYASDKNSSDPFMVERNLNFKSKIYEIAFGMEITMFNYNINKMNDWITPYFFYQLAIAKINPTTEYNGNEYALQNLGTEGQGTPLSEKNPYKLNQLTIPLGIGLKFNLKPRLAMSFEYGIRKTFTDYLDDVSGNYVDPGLLSDYNGSIAGELSDPGLGDRSLSAAGFNRGNAENKDWYSFFGVMITFNPFGPPRCPSDFH